MMARKYARLAAGSVALAVGVACLTAAPAAARPDPVQSIVDGHVEAGVPGAMVYAQDRRARWTVSSGTRELGADRPIRSWDRVRVASNTKMFLAAVVLQLAEMRTVIPANGGDYGLGLREYPLPCGGVAWGHGGNIPGFDTFTAATKDGRSAFAVANGRTTDGTPANLRKAVETALCE